MAIIIKDGIEGRICSRCRIWKSLIEYYGKDKSWPFCKTCDRIRVKNPDNKCAKCKRRRGDFKDYGGSLDEEFGKHLSYCKKCARENWRQRASPGGVTYAAALRRSEKRRITENGLDGTDRGTYDLYEWELLILVYGNKCLVLSCAEIDIEKDHVIPLTPSGSNEIWNRQPLCKSHNTSKGNRSNADYRPDQGALAMTIHNLRIGQCDNKQDKKRYYAWICMEIKTFGIQILSSLPNIFEWLEPQQLQLAA